MRTVLAAATFLALLAIVVPGAQAQMPAAQLAIAAPSELALVPANGTLQVPVQWTYQTPTPGLGAESITWLMDCSLADLALVDAPATSIEYPPGGQTVQGTAMLQVQAQPDLYPMRENRCTVRARAVSELPEHQAEAQAMWRGQVEFDGSFTATVAATERTAGPQKQLAYPIEVTNNGNGQMVFIFQGLSGPGGKWQLLLPEVLLLDPGESTIAMATVATPYKNGYNSGQGQFDLRISSAAAWNPGVQGTTQDVSLTTNVKGMYVPGPGPALLVLALAAIAVRLRRS